MPRPLRILQYGLGPIGITTARAVIEKSLGGAISLVGAVDFAEEKAGRDAGDLLGLEEPTGVIIQGRLEDALAESQPHVVLHTTSSFLPRVMDQLETCIRAGVHVVSSTEELAYPHERHAELSRRLDALAKEHGVAIVGTGVNPGFAMDVLPLAATAPCLDVRSVRVNRVVDAGKRREPLQRKVGAGLSVEEFQERKASGTFGHIGLVESLRMLAAGLDWPIDEIEETLRPVVATARTETAYLTVDVGQVAGIHHVARGLLGGRPVLELDLQMYVGAPNPRDEVDVDGDPAVHLIAHGGIFGDPATAAMLINTAGLVSAAPPGLLTMKDLPVPRAFATTTGVVHTTAA